MIEDLINWIPFVSLYSAISGVGYFVSWKCTERSVGGYERIAFASVWPISLPLILSHFLLYRCTREYQKARLEEAERDLDQLVEGRGPLPTAQEYGLGNLEVGDRVQYIGSKTFNRGDIVEVTEINPGAEYPIEVKVGWDSTSCKPEIILVLEDDRHYLEE